MSMELNFLSWFEKPIKQSIESVFNGINIGVEALDLLDRYQSNHFARVSESLGVIKILGMNTPIPLKQVYYTTTVSTTIHRRLYEEDWRKLSENRSFRKEQKVRDSFRGDTYVDRTKRVVVLGGPGAGKTTFLKHLALAHVDKDVFEKTKLTKSRFPVYLSLPLFAKDGALSIEDSLVKVVSGKNDEYTRAYVSRLLKIGRMLVLLDSLDEVPQESRKEVVDKINKFVYDYPDACMVISCRTADYEEVFQEFCEVEVTHLSKVAIERIIRGWFRGERQKAEKLIKELGHNSDISQLTENPLLLSLLCIQYNDDLKLPGRKVELYRRCIEALLIRWDTSRNFRRDTAFSQLTDERKEKLFEYVAGVFFAAKPTYIFDENDVAQKIGEYCRRFHVDHSKAQDVLREIESHHGILEKYSARSYCFSHPSFQEYFVARRCLATNKEMEAIKSHYEDDNWTSVIEFIVAIKEEPGALVDFLKSKSSMQGIKQYPAMTKRTRHLWLLYKCLAAGPSLSPEHMISAIGHVFHSQIEIYRVFKEGGVFPVARLLSDGVAHAYYYNNRRTTLSDALQQYRMLSSEILATAFPAYADMVIRETAKISVIENEIENTSLLLCLLIPVSGQSPREVKALLLSVLARVKQPFLKDIIEESLAMLEKAYL